MSVTPLRRSDGRDEKRSAPPGPGDEVSESSPALATRVANDDVDAFQMLIDEYWGPLISYARRMLDDQSLAEEIVQRVFVSLWEGRATWSPQSIKAYLFRSTRNLIIDRARSREARRRREAGFHAHGPRSAPSPEAVLTNRERRVAIDAAIQGLPDRRREAFILTYLRQMSYREAADIMGVSVKTVGHHVSAALADLREVLAEIEEGSITGG